MYLERTVTCASTAEAGRYSILTPDLDHYVDDIFGSGDAEEDDFADIVYTNGWGTGPRIWWESRLTCLMRPSHLTTTSLTCNGSVR